MKKGYLGQTLTEIANQSTKLAKYTQPSTIAIYGYDLSSYMRQCIKEG